MDIAINNIIMKLGDIDSGIILAGDFNYNSDDIQWEYDSELKKNVGKIKSPKENLFIEAVHESKLNQHINFKTFIKTVNRDSLDLVFTDDKHKVTDIKQEPFLGNSIKAHIGISWKYKLNEIVEIQRKEVGDHEISRVLVEKKKRKDEHFQKFPEAYDKFCKDLDKLQSLISSMYFT